MIISALCGLISTLAICITIIIVAVIACKMYLISKGVITTNGPLSILKMFIGGGKTNKES